MSRIVRFILALICFGLASVPSGHLAGQQGMLIARIIFAGFGIALVVSGIRIRKSKS